MWIIRWNESYKRHIINVFLNLSDNSYNGGKEITRGNEMVERGWMMDG